MSEPRVDTEKLRELDERVVRASRDIHVLSRLAWPPEVGERFLQGWDAGRPELPQVDYGQSDLGEPARELAAVMDCCDRAHPLEDFVYRTARSYARAIAMLGSAGSREFAGHSRAIFGDPSQAVTGEEVSTATAAARVMESTDPFVRDCRLEEDDFCVLPSTIAAEMTRHAEFFEDDQVDVVIDDKLSSKAAAGARRVRIRGGTCFTSADLPQLVHHELFMHTLTALNGRRQPTLRCLGLGAPRTTRTQEGLALFAELITNSIDINRLRRIAARVVAIESALGGADFIEIFRYFVEVGQTRGESFASAQRVFRGADVRGGSAFTKDGVYFQGLVRVHRFLRDAAREGRVEDPGLLMAGRLRTGDVLRLAPWFESGLLAPPRYLPGWVGTRSRLIAFLLYSSFAAELHLDSLIAPREVADSGE